MITAGMQFMCEEVRIQDLDKVRDRLYILFGVLADRFGSLQLPEADVVLVYMHLVELNDNADEHAVHRDDDV